MLPLLWLCYTATQTFPRGYGVSDSCVSSLNEEFSLNSIVYVDENDEKLDDTSVSIRSHDASHENVDFCHSVYDTHDCSDMINESVRGYLNHMKDYRIKNAKNCIIGHLNVNSIRNKFDAIEYILSEGLVDIFAISESKLDESFPLSQFSVTDFSNHRKDRNRHGGGLMIYVRSDILHRRRLDLEPSTLNSYENEVLVIETRPYKAEKWFGFFFINRLMWRINILQPFFLNYVKRCKESLPTGLLWGIRILIWMLITYYVICVSHIT